MGLGAARETMKSLLIGPRAYTVEELRSEIAKVEQGQTMFDWANAMRKSREHVPRTDLIDADRQAIAAAFAAFRET